MKNGKFYGYKSIFHDFESFYEFLNGEIYDQSCYFQYDFSNEEIEKFKVDLSKINSKALIDETIDDYTLAMSNVELEEYNKIEKEKRQRQKWIDRINTCNNSIEYYDVFKNFRKSKFYSFDFIVWYFVFSNEEKAFDILMNLINDNNWYKYEFRNLIYSVYYIYKNEKDVLSLFKGSSKERSNLKKFIKDLSNSNINIETLKYFDKKTHYYCCKTIGVEQNEFGRSRRKFEFTRYFYNFKEFANYFNNDLSGCDLSNAILSETDFSKYIMNKKTKLPISDEKEINYSLIKQYNRMEEQFEVIQIWKNRYGSILKRYENSFN